MTHEEPLVYIGMPVYNGERYLQTTIQSLLQQTYSHFKLIISDDNSTDHTEKVCRVFTKIDKRIHYIKQKEHQGFVNNFNFVLEKAKGKYFMWASQDDFWHPSFIKILVTLLQKYPDAILAMSNYANVDGSKKYPYKKQLFDNNASHFHSVKNFISTYNLSYFYGLHRTSNLKKIGGYQKDSRPFFKSSDYTTVLKVLMNGKMVYADKVLFYKRDTGFYFKKFSVLRDLTFNRKIVATMFRFLCFPLFFLYDYYFTSRYLVLSHFSPFQKLALMTYALFTFVKRNGIFIGEVIKGAVTLLRGIFHRVLFS